MMLKKNQKSELTKADINVLTKPRISDQVKEYIKKVCDPLSS